ncbi:hypothetical protein SLE2022_405590 [Rubroshorea leprosula]|uniref:Uncharacterized protein n=1 Tax=Rubroshorea leprosula TaxID=152421 RepID=A0AAV5MSJ4_9ROSI|nr:hypothetical protein SLEP1_g58317 [Rubroshorea leprosula]
MQTALNSLKERAGGLASTHSFHSPRGSSVFSNNGRTVICIKRNGRRAALSHNRRKASKNGMSAYPIDRTTEATICKSLTPKLKNYRKGNLLSRYAPMLA